MATRAVTTNADVIRRFEEEFKNQLNRNITDELTAPDFQHRLPYKGLPPGRDGLRAIQVVGWPFERRIPLPDTRSATKSPSATRISTVTWMSVKV